jgi:hypothetical protein
MYKSIFIIHILYTSSLSSGAVCPITNSELTRADLVPDDDLKNRIKRYHIQQTSRRTAPLPDDDLYDF